MRRAAVGYAIGGVALLLAGTWFAGLRLNLTASMPVGLYRVIHAVPVRGSVVLVCLAPEVAAFARSRGYVPRGACAGGIAPVGKLVLALPGDTVTVAPEGLSVNGSAVPVSKARGSDTRGRPLPRLQAGRYIVQAGHLWLVARHPLSFDSRYFGAISRASALAVVRPLWTVRPIDVSPVQRALKP